MHASNYVHPLTIVGAVVLASRFVQLHTTHPVAAFGVTAAHEAHYTSRGNTINVDVLALIARPHLSQRREALVIRLKVLPNLAKPFVGFVTCDRDMHYMYDVH